MKKNRNTNAGFLITKGKLSFIAGELSKRTKVGLILIGGFDIALSFIWLFFLGEESQSFSNIFCFGLIMLFSIAFILLLIIGAKYIGFSN